MPVGEVLIDFSNPKYCILLYVRTYFFTQGNQQNIKVFNSDTNSPPVTPHSECNVSHSRFHHCHNLHFDQTPQKMAPFSRICTSSISYGSVEIVSDLHYIYYVASLEFAGSSETIYI